MPGRIVNVHWRERDDIYALRVERKGGYVTELLRVKDVYAPMNVPDEIIAKSERDEEDKFANLVFPCHGTLRALRKAAIVGITVGGNREPGPAPPPQGLEGRECVMGYDLESESAGGTRSMPLPSDDITCGSIACSCGYTRAYRTRGEDTKHSSLLLYDSSALCARMHEDILAHRPVWLVGYNSFRFDNLCLSYHGRGSAKYEAISVKSTGKASPALMMYEQGINNVDAYVYMDIVYRSKFPSLTLGVVAETLGLGSKLVMMTSGDMHHSDAMEKLVEYNIRDSEMVRDVFIKLGLARQLILLCSVMKSSLIDTSRYATGVMCACMLSSYAASTGKLLDWSRCTMMPDEFEGGLVLDPMRGLHRNVVVVDFKSMYPSIMIGCSVSHDNVRFVREEAEAEYPDDITWDSKGTVTVLASGHRIKFKNNPKCMSRQALGKLLEFRAVHGAGDEVYSTAIKVATNSLFGSLGFIGSPLYSPLASLSVTAIGRWCLRRAREVIERHGLTVIYGDTDSCFVKSSAGEKPMDTKTRVERALIVFHEELRETPLSFMKLSIEVSKEKKLSVQKALILLNKKCYVLTPFEGTMKSRGVCLSRKDKLPVVVELFRECVMIISAGYCIRSKRAAIFIRLHRTVARIINGECRLGEISMKKRKFGNMCYVFRKTEDKEAILREDKCDANARVAYCKRYVLNTLLRTLGPMLTVCGIGSVKYLMSTHLAP